MFNLSFLRSHGLTLGVTFFAAAAFGQNITWTGPIGITGDANLSTNGIYLDALILNTGISSSLAADGVIFNIAASQSAGTYGDGTIDYTASGLNNFSWNGSFPVNSSSSAAFAAVMDAGGIYQNGGNGTGTVTLSGLLPGYGYQVQVFNFAPDGDAGLTTLSGVAPVTLSNLPGAGGANTDGEFATGTFVATNTTESFNWNGAGSGYTVMGAISVRKLPITPTVAPTNAVSAGASLTLSVIPQSAPTSYQWQSDDGSSGTIWTNIPGAISTNEMLNTTGFAPGTYEYQVLITDNSLVVTSAPVAVTILGVPAQNITWGPAAGIVGDASLATSGAYWDALMVNSSISSVTAVDGVDFNPATSLGNGAYGDSRISYAGSGLNNFGWPNSFPVSASASSSFANLMNDGGIFQNGGAGTGTVTLSGLTIGHDYLVQVFNYAPDGDPGLTTFSGTTTVTLNNLPGAAGANTYGEFANGTFTASTTAETFNWNGAGSSYTVLGSLSVRDVSAVATIEPTNVAYLGDSATLAVNPQPTSSWYQWQTDGGSRGATWSNLSDANSTNEVIDTATLTVGNYEYRVVVTNSLLNVTSAPVTLTVLAPSAPVVLQPVTPAATTVYVGQSTAFSAAFTGNQPIANQWQFSSDGGNTFIGLPDQTNLTLQLNNLQLTNSGEYRLAAVNAYGSNNTPPANLNVEPWSDAQIQWQSPTSIQGLTAGQILTNAPGAYLEAADFFYDAYLTVNAGNQQYVFRPDGNSASILGTPYYNGQFETNAIFGSGVWVPNSTGDANFDGVLNQFYDGGISNVFVLNHLVSGQQYSVQLFSLDNRSYALSESVDFADAVNLNDYSSSLTMGNDLSLTGTFTATNTYQVIQENLLSGLGNINALVVRALSYTPAVPPTIVRQPRERVSFTNGTASLSVVADASPSPTFQWQAGPVGGPYTNLTDGSQFAGSATATLTINQFAGNNSPEFVVSVTNSVGGLTSTPVDFIVPVIAQPSAMARPIHITCVGASDVSSPTPYGTPNWPDYIAPMLGYEYAITNCGASGTTMIQAGNAPYWNTSQYTSGLNSSPDIVIIMLGSNDSKPYNWVYQTNYVPDYEALINQYRSLPSHPRIYLNTLLTVYGPGNYDITDPIVTGQLCPIIKQLAFDQNLPIIDINAATKNMPQNFPDDVHPNIAGAKVVAQTIFNGLMNNGETPPMTDLALNSTAYASTSINGNVASNAVDADYTTFWQSAAANSQWIYVDLGSTMNLDGVFLNWGPDYAQSYVIQVSTNALNWTGVYTNNAGAGGIDRIPLSATGRFVRMLGMQSGTGNGYDLLDFTVTAPAQPPVLNVSQVSGNGLKLSWPGSASAFSLQATSSLQPPINWTTVTSAVTSQDGSNYLTVQPTGKNQFYRLRQLL